MSWEAKLFRDCNGESNGIELPAETIQAEGVAGGDFVFPEETGGEEKLAQQQSSAPPLSVLPPPDQDENAVDTLPVSGLYLPPASTA